MTCAVVIVVIIVFYKLKLLHLSEGTATTKTVIFWVVVPCSHVVVNE
jgi:hypothetical protein